MTKKILIRVDASIEIGAGHFVRQLALAQLLIDEGFDVYFLTKTTQKELINQAIEEGVHIQTLANSMSIEKDAKETVAYAKKIGAQWVILDGYSFVTKYQQTLKSEGLKLLCVDDMAHCHFVADIVLNQNTTDSSIYSKEPYTKLLMGPEYALLRREFRLFESKKVIRNEIKDIMITMGGSDEKNMTETILKWLLDLPELNGVRCHIVLGSLNPHKDLISALLSQSNLDGKIYTALSAKEMLNLMQSVDFAITAAGSTVWEYMKVGVPFLYTRLFENQNITKQVFKQKNLDKFEFFEEDLNSFIQAVEYLKRYIINYQLNQDVKISDKINIL
jgi:UDP-2,4-diacetamido-2,4,6-trideoxy-beta-L-altropyranose hydrolase